MFSTLLILLLAIVSFSVSSAASGESSSFHPLSSSSAVVPSFTPSSTGKNTGLATTLPESSSQSLSLPQTTSTSIYSTTSASSQPYRSSSIPPNYASSSSSSSSSTTKTQPSSPSSTPIRTIPSSGTNPGTVYSSSSRVSTISSSISSSTSISISTTISSESSSGRATALTNPSSIPGEVTSLSSSWPSSSGANTWSFSTTQSTTPFPVYQTPTVTVTGGPAETSQAVQFFTIFSVLYQDRQLISDPEHKTDYINYVKNTKSHVQAFINSLSVQPPTDVGCSGTTARRRSSKSKRGLLSVISSLVGDVGNLLACANQVLSNMESVVDEVDPSISEIEALTDAINEIGGDLQNTNEDKPTTASQPTDSLSTTSKTSSSSSSCTSETALHVTVLCMPTTITTAGSTFSTTTCSPSTTITTKGCSVTGWTSTISSSTSTPSQIPCASDTCGDSCPMGGGPLSVASVAVTATIEDCASISTITTSALPTASYGAIGSATVVSPTPKSTTTSPAKRRFSNDPGASDNATLLYDSLIKRVLPEVTSPNPAYVASLNPIWISQSGLAAAQWFDFPRRHRLTVGVNGIYGCTAVIIPSEKGVYFSHIWENPVFINDQYEDSSDTDFRRNTFTALNSGSATSESIQRLIGTDENPGPLHAIYAPKVFVVTPFTTDFDFDNFGITTELRYQDRVQQLANSLAQAIPGSGGSGFILGYTRTNAKKSTEAVGTAGRAIFEFDPVQFWLETDTPDSLPLQVGQWRFWIEDQLVSVQNFWVPWVTLPAGSGIQQRDTVGYANPCSYTNTSSTSISMTSSSASISSLSSSSLSSSSLSSSSLSSSSSSSSSPPSSSPPPPSSTRFTSSSVIPSSSSTFSTSPTTKSATTSPPPSTLVTSRSTATVPTPTMTSSTSISPTLPSSSMIKSSTTPSSSTTTAPPICSEDNNQLMGVNNTPASWCYCGGRGPFSTISGSTTSYCAFSVLPTQTISLTSQSTYINTACVLTTTMYAPSPSASPTQDVYCQCGDVQAGIGTTTIGNDVVLGCELSPTWAMISTISTIAPTTATTTTSSTPPYQTGVCDVHITEISSSYNAPLYIQLNITDGGGNLLTSQHYQTNWGDSVSVAASDSKLPYDIDVDFTNRTAQGAYKRMVVPPPPVTIDWEDWVLTLTAGSTAWNDTVTDSSTLPYCSVGGWDNEDNFWQWLGFEPSGLPNRQMDCRWTC